MEVICYVVMSGVLDVVLLVVIHKMVEYMGIYRPHLTYIIILEHSN